MSSDLERQNSVRLFLDASSKVDVLRHETSIRYAEKRGLSQGLTSMKFAIMPFSSYLAMMFLLFPGTDQPLSLWSWMCLFLALIRIASVPLCALHYRFIMQYAHRGTTE